MTTALKGNTTEAAVLSAFAERDFAVLVPFGEGHPYDLVVHLSGDTFLRVQCKTGRVRKGVLQFNTNSTDHGNGPGNYHDVADLFGVFCAEPRLLCLVPVCDVPMSVGMLRVEPTRNNQARRIRWAADYEFSQWDIDRLLDLRDGSEAHRTSLAPV